MKKKICAIFLICTIISISLLSTNIFTTNAIEDNTIKVGYIDNFTMFNQPFTKGKEGYGYEYLIKISEQTGWNYEFIECTWEEGIELLENGKIDLLGPNQYNSEYKNKFLSTSLSIGDMNTVLLADNDNPISYNDYENLQGKKVALSKNSVYEDIFIDYCDNNNIKMELIYVDDVNLLDISTDTYYDYILTGGQNIISNTKVILKVGVTPIKFLASKNNADIIEEMDKAIKKIYDEDFNFSHKLYTKYYADRDYANPALTAEEKKAFIEKNTLKIGYGVDYAPLQYTDVDGQPAGVCIDILNLVADRANINIEFVPLTRGVEYTGSDIDASISFTNGELLVDFNNNSTDYVDRNLLMIGSAYSQAIENKNVVGVIDYSNIVATSINTVLPSYEFKTFQNSEELKTSLENGDITHVIATAITIDKLSAELSKKKYAIYGIDTKLPFDIKYSSNISKDYITGLDKIISSIEESTKDAIYLDNIKKIEVDYSLRIFVEENAFAIGIVCFSLFFGILIFVLLSNRNTNRKIVKILEYDDLMEVSTFYKFRKDAQEILKTAKPKEYMLISIDIDNFKYINEHYGYDFGTKLIQTLVKLLKRQIGGTSVIARVFADEIIILTKYISEEELIYAVNNQIFSSKNTLTEQEINSLSLITISLGCHYITDTQKDIVTLINFATVARKSKKHNHGNSIAFYDTEMDKKRENSNFITSQAKNAIAKKEFELYLQPQIEAKSNNIRGVEVLVRWVTNNKMIPPNEFISIFEKSGFIVQLDLYILEATIELMNDLRSKGHITDEIFSINISRNTLLDSKAVNKMIKLAGQCKDTHMKNLEIEITESAFISDKTKLTSRIKILKKAGYKIAMDDFGAEYSSLSSLLELPIDIVKLDKCMIDAIKFNNGEILFTSILTMLESMGYEIIVEGVENLNQIEFLSKFKNICVQGYYYSRPLKIDDYIKYNEEHKKVSTNN